MVALRSKRARYQEMAAEELITLDELRARLAELGETRETAERELAALRDRAGRIEELERDAEAILEGFIRMTPEALESLTPEKRHRFYKMLGLRVTTAADGSIEISGTFIADGPLRGGDPNGASRNGRTNGSTRRADLEKSALTGARLSSASGSRICCASSAGSRDSGESAGSSSSV